MADKTVAQKLLIKPGYTIRFINAPADYEITRGPLPADVAIAADATTPVDLAQVFVTTAAQLAADVLPVKAQLKPGGLLWICWPKGGSKLPTDLNRNSLARLAQGFGLEAVSNVAVDSVWSALRFKLVG